MLRRESGSAGSARAEEVGGLLGGGGLANKWRSDKQALVVAGIHLAKPCWPRYGRLLTPSWRKLARDFICAGCRCNESGIPNAGAAAGRAAIRAASRIGLARLQMSVVERARVNWRRAADTASGLISQFAACFLALGSNNAQSPCSRALRPGSRISEESDSDPDSNSDSELAARIQNARTMRSSQGSQLELRLNLERAPWKTN